MISFDSNIKQFERSLSDFGRNQLPFALSQALNDTIEEVDQAWKTQLPRRLESPTPFTKRGTFRRRASKRRLVSTVAFKTIQSDYLRLQVTGGQRRPKGQAFLIPVGQRLNKYGNLPRGALARVKRRTDTFVASRGEKATKHLAPGIYQRPKRGAYMKKRSRKNQVGIKSGYGNKNVGKMKGPKLLIAFEDRARYQPRLDLEPIAVARSRAVFERNCSRRFKQAMATAR